VGACNKEEGFGGGGKIDASVRRREEKKENGFLKGVQKARAKEGKDTP